MNLLKQMKEEVASLQLEDELAIIRYLYIRTGEIFDYNPRFEFVDLEEKKKINALKLDIENVEEFEITCATWADLFKKLLEPFGIASEVIPFPNGHAFVLITLKNGKKIKADLFIGLLDITAIKLGMPTCNLSFIDKKTDEQLTEWNEIDKRIHYRNTEMTIEEALNLVKQQINALELSEKQKKVKILEATAIILNFPRQKTKKYCIGSQMIFDIINTLANQKYPYTTFSNLIENKYADIYTLKVGHDTVYFAYEEIENKETNHKEYIFHEIAEEKVEEYLEQYDTKDTVYLKRTKNNRKAC